MNSTRVQSLIAQEQVFEQTAITSVNKWQRLLILAIIAAIAGCEWLFVYKDVASGRENGSWRVPSIR